MGPYKVSFSLPVDVKLNKSVDHRETSPQFKTKTSMTRYKTSALGYHETSCNNHHNPSPAQERDVLANENQR
jgi:hypothetical protein